MRLSQVNGENNQSAGPLGEPCTLQYPVVKHVKSVNNEIFV